MPFRPGAVSLRAVIRPLSLIQDLGIAVLLDEVVDLGQDGQNVLTLFTKLRLKRLRKIQ